MDYWGQNITELVLDRCQWKAEEACGYSVVSKQLEDDGGGSADILLRLLEICYCLFGGIARSVISSSFG